MAIPTLLCYALEDKRMVGELEKHLGPLKRNNDITILDHSSINSSAKEKEKMNKSLEEAQIIMLLISADFIDSNYCYEVQLPKAIERHERKEACVIPVILRHVHWERPPLDKLGQLQPLPGDRKPIREWRSRDKGYTDVAKGIERVVEQWNSRSLPSPTTERKIMIAKLDQLIESIKVQMTDSGRANAAAETLRQLSTFIPIDVTLADLIVGWRILSHPSQPEEEIAISRRRTTCSELASFASQLTADEGDLAQAIKTWEVWRDVFQHRLSQNSDDPRAKAMAKAFAREFAELQDAAR